MQYIFILIIMILLSSISFLKLNSIEQITSEKNIITKSDSNINIVNNGTANINIFQGPITIIEQK